jgi:hypothetical protein
MADRYCRNCGHELAEDDRYCPSCGKPVHEVAHVPTPEADVPAPPPPQQAGDAASPQQEAEPPPLRHRRGLGAVSLFNRLSGPKKIGVSLGGIVAIVTIISGLVTITDLLIGWYKELTYEEPTPKLAYVDVGFLNKPAELDYPVDIKLRNTGKGTALITQADLRVEKIWTLTPPYLSRGGQCAFVDVSHKYQMELPTKGAPFVRKKELSQSVKSGGVDRFTIHFDYNNLKQISFNDYVFFATLSLIYGEDNEQVNKDVLFASSQIDCNLFYKPGNGHVLRKGLEESDANRLASQNEQNLQEIGQTKAVKSDYVQQLVRSGERPEFASASASSTATASASAPSEPANHDNTNNRSREDVYNIGEKIKVGDIAYTVTDAQLANSLKGNTCSVQDHPHGQGGPRVTKNAIAAEIHFTNNSNERIKFRDLGLHLYDSKGRQYKPQNMFGGICNRKDIFERKWLEPGNSQEAQVYYFVPLDASGFELEVAFDSFPGKVARIKLGF